MAPRTTGALALARRARQGVRVQAPVFIQTRGVAESYLAKVAQAEAEWEARSAEIRAGERKHVWDVFEERGFIKDVAGRPELIKELILKKRIGTYVGIDPTAESLHVGHLLPLMPLFWLYYHGLPTSTLIGGATARVGDPTGRLKSRDVMSNSDIAKNITKIHYQLKKLWANVESTGRKYGYDGDWAGRPYLRNNNMWLNQLPLYDFLKRLGRFIRIGPMLSRETVKRKMTEGDGMSFAELTYPLLQGWDFWQMYQKNGVQMQVGGSDQYGNIVSGIEIVKTIRDTEPAEHLKIPTDWTHDPVGFTVPLLTDSSGAKFGKSAGNAVWLDNTLTSPFDFYGYFVRRPDEDIERLLKLFTFLPLSDIDRLMKLHSEDVPRRIAQHVLAFEVTSLVHGPEVALREQMQHQLMFNKAPIELPPDMVTSAKGVKRPAGFAPVEGLPTTSNEATQETIKLPASLITGKSVARILYACGLASSTTEGTRLVQQGGAYVAASPGPDKQRLIPGSLDWTPVKTWFPSDTAKFLIDGRLLILRRGKYNVRIIDMVSDEEWKASGMNYPGEPYTGKLRQVMKALKEKGELKKGPKGEEGVEGVEGEGAGEGEEVERPPLRVVPNNPDLHFPSGPKKGVGEGTRAGTRAGIAEM
ncbi:related to tyrosine--trna ligase precursor, mitochondrial [Cephalotrichum gorgonifer]|uniref:Tyrosine--tRNA ligase n=1 Tax=Cephalotrichum gorgonifer TaxID=2041049 RepID=A0AAE8SUZ3_9PEZI|nr:related to tyrosine--trna ligase precursor, mitochondrial [Cephalotrichum gorgonifer]